jgi:hypothetical protein
MAKSPVEPGADIDGFLAALLGLGSANAKSADEVKV